MHVLARPLIYLSAIFCCTCADAFAAANREIENQVTVRVSAVQPDATLTLSSLGEAVLADVVFPHPPSAVAWLSEYALQRETTLTAGKEDRYGRLQVRGQLQQDMLNDGAAVIYAAEEKIPKEWFAAEARARAAGHGVWDVRAQPVQTAAADAVQHIGQFHVIEGTITRIYEGKSATYLNFGEDWHTDFSVTIPARNRRAFASVLGALAPGSRVRVRGYLYEENGPMIALTRPDNLERIDANP